jgi:uncharacterized protein (TIGR00369 family)
VTAFEQYLPQVLAHPLHRLVGLHSVEARDGRSVIDITVNDAAVNPFGAFHGGVVYLLCDLACYTALLSTLQPGENAATHELHVTVLRSAALGEQVRFTGTVIKRGRAIAFMEAEAHAGERLLARASVTKSMLPRSAG